MKLLQYEKGRDNQLKSRCFSAKFAWGNQCYICLDVIDTNFLQKIRKSPDFTPMPESFNKASEAYSIFVAELCLYCENAREQLSLEGRLEEQERIALAAGFHRVKGGAGFFGLEDLRRVAGELEGLLMDHSGSDENRRKTRMKFEDFLRLSREVSPAGGTTGVE